MVLMLFVVEEICAKLSLRGLIAFVFWFPALYNLDIFAENMKSIFQFCLWLLKLSFFTS